MQPILLGIAVILFILDFILFWAPNWTYGGRLTALGLAFFAGSFLV